MNVIRALRTYLGITQVQMSKLSGIYQSDLCDMETKPPYGFPDKYLCMSNYLGVPVEALVKNDFTAIPESFFERNPMPVYIREPETKEQLLGREGEEFILHREQTRLAEQYPALARLVLPHYKMKGPSPGYDIMSFDEEGKPIYLEVKTFSEDGSSFRLSSHEYKVAQEFMKQGKRYVVVTISDWGKDTQRVQEISFSELCKTYKVSAGYYLCAPIPEKEFQPISGLAYYRKARGLRQVDLAEELNVPPSNLCLYETGQMRASIDFYIRASQFLGVTVDELLAKHDPVAIQE